MPEGTISDIRRRRRCHANNCTNEKHQISQTVSHRLPTAGAGGRTQVRSCGICGAQSDSAAGFGRVRPFPPPIHILPTSPHSLITLSSILHSLGAESVLKEASQEKCSPPVRRDCTYRRCSVELLD
jgi:hypothetical protein